MNWGRTLRVALAVACACAAFGATPARATVYFVDGACPTSGTGTGLACGATGPFRTIGEGVEAMAAGDTLNIRGAHGTFDGTYFEQVSLQDGGTLPGKAVRCTAGSPCVIEGCRAPACPADEVPIVRGMSLRADWTNRGGGVYSRTMEATPEPDTQGRSANGPDYDPYMVMENDGAFPMTMLAYAGDDDTTPADGEWSYITATHEIYVNPTASAAPATSVYVPHYAFNVHLESPTAYVTLQYFTTEGTRGRGMELRGNGSSTVPGLVIRGVTQRYVTRHFILGQNLPGLVIEDSVGEYGCRGWSFANSQSDGCFGYRLFAVHGAAIRRNVLRHMGSTGRGAFKASGAPWPCPWCDAPWNDPNHTAWSSYGLAYQIKQTDGAVVEDNTAEEVATGGISLDVSRNVTVQRNTLHRLRTAIGMRNFTPTGGCPTVSPSQFCYNSDHVIRENVIDEAGLDDMDGCAINITGGNEKHTGALMLAQIYNNVISHPAFGAICVQNDAGSTGGSATPTADVSIWHNTVYGDRSVGSPGHGLLVANAVQNVVVRNNAFDGIATDALVLASEAMAGLTLDGDVLGAVGGCQVRWNLPTFTSIPSGGTCSTLTAFTASNPGDEAHGRTGALLFANVAASPPDLHLTAGSVAIDADTPIPGVADDMDGTPRPQGGGADAGADEFTGGMPTTTSTVVTTTTSASTSSSSTTTTVRPTTSSSTTRPSTTTNPSGSSTTSTSTVPGSTTTLVVGSCGNGVVDAGEECDDGNLAALDGCDGSCLLEQIAETAFSRSIGTPMDAPMDPLAASIVAPTAGDLMVIETSTTTPAPEAFHLSRRQVHVEAAPATMAKPLVLHFTVEGSAFAQGADARYLQVFRDGTLVRPCPRSHGTMADCLSPRFKRSPGEAALTVLTTSPGEWNFGVPTGAEPAGPTIDRCLGATKLLMKSSPSNPSRRRFLLKSDDAPELVVGNGRDAAALVDDSGSLHVKAIGGDGFEALYPLSPAGWQPLDSGSPNTGLRYKDPYGPITSIVFKAGLGLQVKGKGPGLVQTLGSEPATIQVELRIGQYRYRFEFGGDSHTFAANKQLVRKWTLRPECPAAEPQ